MDHRQDMFCKREITTSRSKIAKKKLSPKKRSALWIDADQTLDNYQHEKYVAILHRHEFDKISPESQKFIKTISSIPYNLITFMVDLKSCEKYSC